MNNAQAAASYYARKRNRAAQLADPVVDVTSRATGFVTFSTNAAQTVTLGGTVVTFGTSFALGATLPLTLANLLVYLNASADTNIVKCTYAIEGSALTITYKTPNVATFTLAASAGTRSAATLALDTTYQRVPL